MTELERIEFAAAAMACKRKGLLSHSAPTSITGEQAKCIPGRIRHQFDGNPTCIHCGGVSARPDRPLKNSNRLKGLAL